MKIKNFTKVITILGLVLFISCQQEETSIENGNQSLTEDVFAKNWQEAELSTIFTGKEMNYPITNQQLQNVLKPRHVYQVRFVPGIIDNELQVKVLSIDASGKVLAEELVQQSENIVIQGQLEKMGTTVFDKNAIDDQTVAKHIIPYTDAIHYLTAWQQKATTDINEITSYNGQRIRHFSLEPAVVKHMIGLESESINLSWGLNDDHKLTTVFVPVSNGSVAVATKNGDNGPAYDFTNPCPPFCDPY